MPKINIEIKARTQRADFIRQWLKDHHADFKGTDYQTDTYFHTKKGRLKLREGNIENNLIYYERENQAGPKQSDFSLLKVAEPITLKEMLAESMGVRVIVSKKREIYFIENVKFHIDELETLGSFVEIEASNKTHDLPIETLRKQCDYYMKEFEIEESDLVNISYSDMLDA